MRIIINKENRVTPWYLPSICRVYLRVLFVVFNVSESSDLTVRQLITPPRNCQPPDVRISRNKTYKNHNDSDKYLQ